MNGIRFRNNHLLSHISWLLTFCLTIPVNITNWGSPRKRGNLSSLRFNTRDKYHSNPTLIQGVRCMWRSKIPTLALYTAMCAYLCVHIYIYIYMHIYIYMGCSQIRWSKSVTWWCWGCDENGKYCAQRRTWTYISGILGQCATITPCWLIDWQFLYAMSAAQAIFTARIVCFLLKYRFYTECESAQSICDSRHL